MSNEWDRRGNVDGGGRGGSTVSRSSKPGGGTLVGHRYAGIAPPQSDSTAAAPVQCKNLFASLPGLEENQPVRDDDPLDFTTLYSSQLGAAAVSTPIQRRQSLEPANDPVHDRGPMLNLVTSAVQRRATTSAMDAPRAVREDRATIGAAPGAAAREQSTEVDASKADSLSEDRATIAPEAESAPGPLAPERAARAAAKNPALVARHGISAAELGTDAAPDSAAFAQAVAGFQEQHGLAVDGIVGPKTAAVVRGGAGPEEESTAAESSAPADTDARGAGSSLRQMKAAPGAATEDDVHRAAAAGIASGAEPLPHLQRIQAAFGGHDVTGVKAHVGGPATEATAAMGAEAYATGNHVAFGAAPDVHTAAHEAAHVVQQRGGVQLKGGIGEAGDSYEQHADAVADRVVRGESAEDLLSAGGSPSHAVQHKGKKKQPAEDHSAFHKPGYSYFEPQEVEGAKGRTFNDSILNAVIHAQQHASISLNGFRVAVGDAVDAFEVYATPKAESLSSDAGAAAAIIGAVIGVVAAPLLAPFMVGVTSATAIAAVAAGRGLLTSKLAGVLTGKNDQALKEAVASLSSIVKAGAAGLANNVDANVKKIRNEITGQIRNRGVHALRGEADDFAQNAYNADTDQLDGFLKRYGVPPSSEALNLQLSLYELLVRKFEYQYIWRAATSTQKAAMSNAGGMGLGGSYNDDRYTRGGIAARRAHNARAAYEEKTRVDRQ